jgi:hypothetical protein
VTDLGAWRVRTLARQIVALHQRSRVARQSGASVDARAIASDLDRTLTELGRVVSRLPSSSPIRAKTSALFAALDRWHDRSPGNDRDAAAERFAALVHELASPIGSRS